MVKNPRQPTNMDSVENDVQGGVCVEATVRSRQGMQGQTLRRCRSGRSTQSDVLTSEYIFCFTIPTVKSDGGFAREIPQQHCRRRDTGGRKWRSTRGIVYELINLSQHSGIASKGNQVSVQTDERSEKERDSDLQQRNDGRRWHDVKRMPKLRCGRTFRSAQR